MKTELEEVKGFIDELIHDKTAIPATGTIIRLQEVLEKIEEIENRTAVDLVIGVLRNVDHIKIKEAAAKWCWNQEGWPCFSVYFCKMVADTLEAGDISRIKQWVK